MPTKKTPAEAVITQFKNLSVKSPEELDELIQVEVIKVTPPDTMGVSSKAANTISFQVESQNLSNTERNLLHQNTRLTKIKRKSGEQVLHFTAFKRRKLVKVGNHSKFDTDRTRYEIKPQAE